MGTTHILAMMREMSLAASVPKKRYSATPGAKFRGGIAPRRLRFRENPGAERVRCDLQFPPTVTSFV